NLFPAITNPNIIQSVFLGVAVAGSSIVPGVDSAVILSSLGLYELYVSSIAYFDLAVLIPADFGLVIGVLLISFIMNKLISRFYSVTLSIIYGLFLSIITNVLNESCVIGFNENTLISFMILIIGFTVSYFLGNIEGNYEKLKKIWNKIKRIKAPEVV